MAIKQYKIEYGTWANGIVTFEVDTERFTKVEAQECLDFFIWDYDKDNCPIEEILKKWTLIILSYGSSNEPRVINQFAKEEGVMPIDGSHGVQLTYCETFAFDDDELVLTVIDNLEEER